MHLYRQPPADTSRNRVSTITARLQHSAVDFLQKQIIIYIYLIVNIIILRYNKIHKRWGLVLTDNLIKEKISLKDSEGNIINCYLYTFFLRF